MLARDEREHDEHGVDLGGVAHDLRVEEVRLEQVDAEDPGEHQQPLPRSKLPDEMSAIATIGTEDRIEPKIGTRLMVAAMPASKSGYLTWKRLRPMYVKAPLMRQITSWPRMTPDRPRSMPTTILS